MTRSPPANDNPTPRWAYLIWCNRLLYRRHEHTHGGRPQFFHFEIGMWIPSAKLGRVLHGQGGIEDDCTLIHPRVAEIGLALMGSPTKEPLPTSIMDGVHPLHQPDHWLFIRLMAGGASLSEAERTPLTATLHWFMKGDSPGKYTNDPMVADSNPMAIVKVDGLRGGEGEGRRYLDAHCRYDDRESSNTSWHDPPPPGSWVIGHTFYGDGLLSASNWDATLAVMKTVIDVRLDGHRKPDGCYVLRTRSWLTTWIDILVLEAGASNEAIECAADIKRRLKRELGILDDADYSRRRQEAAQLLWQEWPIEKRRKVCELVGLPTMLARRRTITNRELLSEMDAFIDG